MVEATANDPLGELAGYGMIGSELKHSDFQEDAISIFSFCGKSLECGHTCKGVQGETKCLICIKEDC